MTVLRFLIIALFLLSSSPPAIAEYYKYIDENGNLMFTDDLNKVPPEQRKNIRSYEEYQPKPIVESDKSLEIKKAPIKKEDKKKLVTLQDRLLKEKDELDTTLKKILETRKKLEVEKDKAITIDDIRKFNLKIQKFNEETMAFDKKRSAYEKKVTDFNQMIENVPPPDNEPDSATEQ